MLRFSFFFFFNDTATTEIYTLSLHDALPIFPSNATVPPVPTLTGLSVQSGASEWARPRAAAPGSWPRRSERPVHTSAGSAVVESAAAGSAAVLGMASSRHRTRRRRTGHRTLHRRSRAGRHPSSLAARSAAHRSHSPRTAKVRWALSARTAELQAPHRTRHRVAAQSPGRVARPRLAESERGSPAVEAAPVRTAAGRAAAGRRAAGRRAAGR